MSTFQKPTYNNIIFIILFDENEFILQTYITCIYEVIFKNLLKS